MGRFFVMEEDTEAAEKFYLGEIVLSCAERKAMFLGDTTYIPNQPLVIPLRHRPSGALSDYSNVKFSFISEKIKDLLDEYAAGKIFYRFTWLTDKEQKYPYYYIAPPLVDCFDYKNSSYEQDKSMPGYLRIKKGFCIRNNKVENVDIFRAEGLSGRGIIISKWLKEVFQENRIIGVNYIETSNYGV